MRRRSIALAATVALGAVVAGATPGSRSAQRPPAGFTGGFGEATCATCHVGTAVNAFAGRVVLTGLPGRYVAGGEYVVTVTLEAEETVRAGFQMAARYAPGARSAGHDAGSFTALDERVEMSDSAGVTYVHQSAVGSKAASSAGASWSVVWTAPRASGVVWFHLAANSGNGDDSPLGDLVYTHAVAVEPASGGDGLPRSAR